MPSKTEMSAGAAAPGAITNGPEERRSTLRRIRTFFSAELGVRLPSLMDQYFVAVTLHEKLPARVVAGMRVPALPVPRNEVINVTARRPANAVKAP